MSPLVTICIPTRNRSGLLVEALESARAQTWPDLEIVVTDNCSSDDTEQVMARYADDPRIRYHRNPADIGFIRNWNTGLALSRGAYVRILCDDDLIDPECIEQSMQAFMDAGPRAGLVCTNYRTIDEAGSEVDDPAFTDETFRIFPETRVEDGRSFIVEYMLGHRRVGLPSAILFRRAALDRPEPFDVDADSMADIEAWAFICRDHDFVYLDEVLGSMRRHANLGAALKRDPAFFLKIDRLYARLMDYAGPRLAPDESAVRFSLCRTLIANTVRLRGVDRRSLQERCLAHVARMDSFTQRALVRSVLALRYANPSMWWRSA